jgi:polysaccharide biosynthesis protein PslH
MGEILFISHRIPFPPDRGDKIRSHHILKHLAQIAPVHVATFADDVLDMAEEAALASLTASYKLVRRSQPLVLAGIKALASHQPVSLTAFFDPGLTAYVSHVLATRPVSAIYVFSGQMGQYVPASFSGRVIADFVDVDSAKFAAYAAKKSGPMSWVQAREAKLLRAEEARFAGEADVSLLISQAEADLFSARLPDKARPRISVRVLANGIDADGYNPAFVDAEPQLEKLPAGRLIFTGQMDYAPNIEAALRVADHILPIIRQVLPQTSFHVVGRNPSGELLERHGKNGCHVWGRVDDIKPWLKGADLALIPLEIARGVQNKVLEAMAMALPVVLTSGAATGIGAKHGQHFSIADSDQALADAVIALLKDQSASCDMGLQARKFVIDTASWPAALADLPEIVGATTRADRDAA